MQKIFAISTLPSITLVLACSSVGILWSQTTASIQVFARDENSAPIAGKKLVLEFSDRITRRVITTDRRGEASLAGLLPGVYYIEGREIRLKADEHAIIRLRIYPAQATVDIEGDSLHRETSSVGIQTVLEARELERLPLPTHRYIEYSYLAPGVTPSGRPEPVVLGSALDSNAYIVDGMVTNLTNGNAGRFGLNISSEIIESQTLTSGGHKAEIGFSAGAVFSLVTKSGTNEYKGSIVGYSVWRSLNARPYSGLANEPGERSTDAREWAVTLGGPVIKDKFFFFGAFNRQLSSIDYENVMAVGSSTPKTRSQEEDRSYRFAKLTWLISDAHRLEFEYFGDPVTQTRFQSAGDITLKDDQMPNRNRGGDSYLLHHVGVITPILSWENTLGIHKTHFYTYPMSYSAGPNRIQLDATGNESFGRSPTELLERISNSSFRSEITLIAGKHRAKAGFQGMENQLTTAFNRPSGGESYTDWAGSLDGYQDTAIINQIRNGLIQLNGTDYGYDSSFSAMTHSPVSGMLVNGQESYLYQRTLASLQEYGNPLKSRTLGFFVQDDWQLNQNWIFNIGMRVDGIRLNAEDGRNIYSQNLPSPRIGISWDPGSRGETRLFVYAGRIYSPPAPGTVTSAGATTSGPATERQVWIPSEGSWKTWQTMGVQGVNNVAIADLKAPRTDLFQIGAERVQNFGLIGKWIFEAVGTLRHVRDLIETYDIVYGYLPELHSLAQTSSTGRVIANLPGLKRDFIGLDLVARHIFEDGHQLQFSYSYGELTGNTEVSNLASSTPANAQFAYNPSIREDYRLPQYNGELNQSLRHSFKMFGTARLPYNLELAGVFSLRTGLHYTPLRRSGGIDYIADGAKRGDHAMPSVSCLDLALAYNLRLKHIDIRFAAEGFNVTNVQPMTRVNNRDADLIPLNHQQPRAFQFSCRVAF